MKVILLQDIARIGKRFEIKNVPDGHALNFLIPKKLAEPATSENVKRLEKQQARVQESATATTQAFTEMLERITGQKIIMPVEANEQGHLFSGVKAEDIAAHLSHEYGQVPTEHVHIAVPLKELGDHQVELSDNEHSGSFTLTLEKK